MPDEIPLPLYDALGRPRSPAAQPGYLRGRRPGNAGKTYEPRVLSPQDVERVLAACGDDTVGLRLRAVIAVLYRTGLATTEVLDATQEDLDLTSGAEKLKVRRGRLVRRAVALDAAAMHFLRPWLEVRSTMAPGHLFCVLRQPSQGGRWADSALRTATGRLGESLGWSRLVPSDFRYSFVADLIIEQWPIPYIQAQLGVTSLSGFERIFTHLGLDRPDDAEVAQIIRTRHWPLEGAAP